MKKFAIYITSVLLLALSGQVYAQSGVTFIVTKTADTNDGACDADCSFREAITAANATPAQDTIHFNIPGTGVKTITPTSALPFITQPVIIDASADGIWTIELNGANAGDNVNGLLIMAANSTVKGLVINRFSLAGIMLMFGGGSTIEENRIGTDAEQTIALGNRDGIYILNSSNNTIEFNDLSGNTDDGVNLASGATNNLIQGNDIGISYDPYDGVGIGNEGDGVKIAAGALNNHLFQNVIGFNTRGIYVEPGETYATGNRFQANTIYLNTGLGIDLGGDGVTPNDVGDADSGPNDLQNYPVLTSVSYAGNNTTINGTLNSTPNTTFTVEFYGFYQGCDPSGYGEGGTYGNSKSVTTDGSGNVSFSHTVNYLLEGAITATATNPANSTSEFSACIVSNELQLGPMLTVNTANDVDDSLCTMTHCSLREALNAANATTLIETIAFNISGTPPHTIQLQPVGPDLMITRPVIIDGTTEPDYAGTPVVELDGNLLDDQAIGLTIATNNTTVRGLAINRFGDSGIFITVSFIAGGGQGNNIIEGNYIGVSPNGTQARGNGFGYAANETYGFGIWVGSPDNRIGGTTPAQRNVIADNKEANIILAAQGSNSIVQGNYIGTNAAGTAALGGKIGVWITGDNMLVGGASAGAGNLIAYNNDAGIRLQGTSQVLNNALLGNRIFSNGGLGIDLWPQGITTNDTGDSDSGINNQQNFPVLTTVTSSGSSVNLRGTLNSSASKIYRLEFFSNETCDPSGNGEGQVFLGAGNAVTNSAGQSSFNITINSPLLGNTFITATATDPDNNTSEFSACLPVNLVSPQGSAPESHFFTITNPTLHWNRVTWATGYEIQVDETDSFGAPLIASDNTLDSTALSTVVNLPGDGLYYWRIRAKKPDGSWGAWSAVESFLVDAP